MVPDPSELDRYKVFIPKPSGPQMTVDPSPLMPPLAPPLDMLLTCTNPEPSSVTSQIHAPPAVVIVI